MKVEKGETWQGANDDCVTRGGHLVSVHSDDENNFISSLLPDAAFWIGLIKSHKGGQRHWTDNSHYDYDHWKDGGKKSFMCVLKVLYE